MSNHRYLNRAERIAWFAAYCAALTGLVHRKNRPVLLGRICEDHAWVAVDAFRRSRRS